MQSEDSLKGSGGYDVDAQGSGIWEQRDITTINAVDTHREVGKASKSVVRDFFS